MKLSLSALVSPPSLTPACLAGSINPPATGNCKNPEVRKEWRELTRTEQASWINAVKCLNATPRSGNLVPPVNLTGSAYYNQIAPMTDDSTYYDELTYVHMNLNPTIHNTGLFLPWHRQYVQAWTDALRTKCGYTGVSPYWAWEQDAAYFENGSIWSSEPVTGLGSWGDPTDDYTIKDGAFTDLSFAYPVPHKPHRHYIPFPYMAPAGVDPSLYPYDTFKGANLTFTPSEVQNLLNQPTGNFKAFQYYMEQAQSMHTSVHMILGGDLGGLCPAGSDVTNCPFSGAPTISPNEPMFFLHHGNIDRLWWLWQQKNANNNWAFAGGSVQNFTRPDLFPNGQQPWLSTLTPIPTAGMFKQVTIGDVLDIQGNTLCYVYE